MKTKINIAMIMFLCVSIAQADPPILIDPRTGKYLGNLSSNQFDPNSVNNPFGRYGSEFSPDSINNQFGEYGSQFSPNSVNNQFATSAPVIVHRHNSGVGNRSSDATGYNPISAFINGFYEGRDLAEKRKHDRVLRAAEIEALRDRVSAIRSEAQLQTRLNQAAMALIERNRILENELSEANALIRSVYNRPSTPPDYNQYTPPPMTRSDWERLKKQFPAETSNTDVTKQATSGKPVALVNFFDPPKPSTSETNAILEDNKKLDPRVFRGLKTSHAISEIPYWHDIVAKPEFLELPVEEQARLKEIYFNYWIAPHAGDQVETLLQQFMSMKP